MDKNKSLIKIKDTIISKLVNFVKKFFRDKFDIYSNDNEDSNQDVEKNEEKIAANFENKSNYSQKEKIYVVKYDTSSYFGKTNEDKYDGNTIIRKSPFVQKIDDSKVCGPISMSKENKQKLMQKYLDYLDNKISASEFTTNELFCIGQITKREIKNLNAKLD